MSIEQKIPEVMQGNCPRCKQETMLYYYGKLLSGLMYACGKCDEIVLQRDLHDYNLDLYLKHLKITKPDRFGRGR